MGHTGYDLAKSETDMFRMMIHIGWEIFFNRIPVTNVWGGVFQCIQ